MKYARLIDLGTMPYRDALVLQREVHAQVSRSESEDAWIVVEHEPVITLGRNAKRENVLVTDTMLAKRGVDLVQVERGGDVTYHGPGQVVLYPIIKLKRFREVVPFVSALEEAVVDALCSFDISAHKLSEHRGVFVGRDAICAIGLAVKQMTTMHGIALNVTTELDYDQLITPCGMPKFGITSIAKQLGRPVSWTMGRDALVIAIERRFETELRAETAIPI